MVVVRRLRDRVGANQRPWRAKRGIDVLLRYRIGDHEFVLCLIFLERFGREAFRRACELKVVVGDAESRLPVASEAGRSEIGAPERVGVEASGDVETLAACSIDFCNGFRHHVCCHRGNVIDMQRDASLSSDIQHFVNRVEGALSRGSRRGITDMREQRHFRLLGNLSERRVFVEVD